MTKAAYRSRVYLGPTVTKGYHPSQSWRGSCQQSGRLSAGAATENSYSSIQIRSRSTLWKWPKSFESSKPVTTATPSSNEATFLNLSQRATNQRPKYSKARDLQNTFHWNHHRHGVLPQEKSKRQKLIPGVGCRHEETDNVGFWRNVEVFEILD